MNITNTKKFTKKEFYDFLNKNCINSDIIDKFNSLPEIFKYKDNEFTLNIISTRYTNGENYFNFELNYYSNENIEFLFNYKIFNNIELCVNYLICQFKYIGIEINNYDC